MTRQAYALQLLEKVESVFKDKQNPVLIRLERNGIIEGGVIVVRGERCFDQVCEVVCQCGSKSERKES